MKHTDLKQFLKSNNRLEVRPSAVSIYSGKKTIYEICMLFFTIDTMLIHGMNPILCSEVNEPLSVTFILLLTINPRPDGSKAPVWIGLKI